MKFYYLVQGNLPIVPASGHITANVMLVWCKRSFYGIPIYQILTMRWTFLLKDNLNKHANAPETKGWFRWLEQCMKSTYWKGFITFMIKWIIHPTVMVIIKYNIRLLGIGCKNLFAEHCSYIINAKAYHKYYHLFFHQHWNSITNHTKLIHNVNACTHTQ